MRRDFLRNDRTTCHRLLPRSGSHDASSWYDGFSCREPLSLEIFLCEAIIERSGQKRHTSHRIMGL